MPIEWRNKTAVGTPMIDNDHRRLIELINRYEQAIEAKNIKLLKSSFDNLLEYT